MKSSLLILCGLSMLTLSACAKTREQFDFSKKAPDEFAITTRAPLEIPASLDTLPTPRPGAPRPQEMATDQQAKQTIFGQNTTLIPSDGSISEGENILLQKTGASQASNDIRDTVDQETDKLAQENTSTFDKIRGKLGDKTDAPTTLVDPIKETERIRANQKAGVPITEGETPILDE
ncbi:MAG: DUF3035 domain-containing protein [Pseudomonadota bacterium]